MKKTKEEAVIDIINEFCDRSESFSVHDITVELRERVRGNLDLTDVQLGDVDGIWSYPIPHDDHMKVLVMNNIPTGYRATYNGQYKLFEPINAKPSFVGFKPATAPSPAVGDIKGQILGYVNSKIAAQEWPTLKNIQSALKRGSNYGLTQSKSIPTKEIIGVLQLDGRFQIDKGPSNVAQVRPK